MVRTETAQPVQLARHLGLLEATMIGIGAMIGAGIFVLTGLAAGTAGPGALVAFGLNGVVTLLTALSYAELASAVPEAGGGYSFVKKVLPNPVAFLTGWMLWFAYVVACSLYAKGFGGYLLEFLQRYVPLAGDLVLGTLGRDIGVSLLAAAVGVLFLAVNIVGSHASGKAENVITAAKLVILAVFIVFGVAHVMRAPDVMRANFVPLFPHGVSGVVGAMGLTFIAFEGYDLIATVSEEVRDPRRTIPRAILVSVAVTVVIYLLVVFVAIGALDPEPGTQSWELLGREGEVGIVRAAQGFMPSFGVVLILFGGVLSTVSALNATVMASSRVAFAMGRDWMLPNSLSRLHSTRRTPVVAITASGALFVVLAVFAPLTTIGTASSLLFLLTFSVVNLSLVLYRRRSGGVHAGFRVPLFPVTPLLGVAVSVGLAVSQLGTERLAWVLSALWIVIGLAVYQALFSNRVKIADVPKIIESPELLSLRRGRRYKVLAPLANPERVEPLVWLAGQVAVASRGELLALSVVDLPDITPYAEAEPFVDEAQNVLRTAQRLALRQGVPFSSVLKIGRTAGGEIVAAAREAACDLVLLGYKRDEDPLENSVIHFVISHQPCDIAILRSGRDQLGPYQRVLLPIAGKQIHDALKVRLVHSLHQGSGGEVTLMTVVPPGASAFARRRAEDVLERAANIYRIHAAARVVRESDDIASAIVASAQDHDLVLLGMREETWLRAFFYGTVAQQIAGQVGCATLLTKARPPRGSRWRRLLPGAERAP